VDERSEAGEFVEVRLRGLILDPKSEVPVVILRHEQSRQLLPIWIGLFEANAIAVALEQQEPKRPMTHDLLRSALERLDSRLLRIEIHALVNGTYFARLEVERGGKTIEIDSRPSDAIALAVRVGAPIFVARAVLAEAGDRERPEGDADAQRIREWLENAEPEELGKYNM
jgi:uncharacterized protein